jgi:hypothetical protein
MKILTIKNPWADWIITGYQGQFKTTENRSWETLYRGRIMIHVSKTLDRDIADKVNATPEEHKRWREQAGKIIGTVELYDIDREVKTLMDDEGYFHWRLRDPRPLKEPIPVRGALGLWNYGGNDG